MATHLNKHTRHLLTLTTAARRQTDPVKRGKILEKIKQVKQNYEWNKFLAR